MKEKVQQIDSCWMVLLREGWFNSTKGVAYGHMKIDRERAPWFRDEPSWPDGLLCFAYKLRVSAQTSPECWGTFPSSPAVRDIHFLAGVPTKEVLS